MVETKVLEERVNNLINTNKKEHALLSKSQDEIKKQLERITTKLDELDKDFVTRKEFTPVKVIAFSIVGGISMAFLKNIVAFFVN